MNRTTFSYNFAAFIRRAVSVAAAVVPLLFCHAEEFVAGQLLVKPRSALTEEGVQSVLQAHGAKQIRAIHHTDVRVVRVPPGQEKRVADAMRHNPNIEFAEVDRVLPAEAVPNDPSYSTAWHFAKINAPAAWDITTGSADVTIAILDSGVDSTHPDLAPQLVPGWNVYDNNSDTNDVHGHGTAVAGTAAAASNNGAGVTSVAWGCRIMPIRVTDLNGNATYSSLCAGLTYAADHGARVANMSFVVSSSRSVTLAAQYFQSKQGVVTVSSGNYGTFDSTADNPYVLTVSATDPNDAIVSFSNIGYNIDVSAPGLYIYTTSMGGTYGWHSGTSFSAPIVAGIAGLVLSANPGLSAKQVQQIITESADDLGTTGWDTTFGAGRVNAYRAVLAATQTVPADLTAPTVTIAAPVDGGTVVGNVAVQVAASDDRGVTKVELYVDGNLASTSTDPNAQFTWDTTSVPDGTHVVGAVAYDAAGNSGSSPAVSVTTANGIQPPPVVQITSPADQSQTTASRLAVHTLGSDGVVWTEIYFDQRLVVRTKRRLPIARIGARKFTKGAHTVQAIAFDAAGKTASSPVVTVTRE